MVTQAGQRDLEELLEEVRRREGDFAAQLEAVYVWSAARLDEVGRAAWGALPLFPAGAAPEGALRRAVQEVLYRVWAGKAENEAGRAQALGMLGYALSALGRREEALAATQEAVEHYRALAQAHPQAFLPDLAMSLGVHGSVLLALGRPGNRWMRPSCGKPMRCWARRYSNCIPLWRSWLRCCWRWWL